MQFTSPSKGSMTLEQVVTDILAYVGEDPDRPYKLLVGTDSKPFPEGTCFVRAIIIHRLGKGARYYYNKAFEARMYSLRQRIFYEASLSLELSDQLYKCLKEQGPGGIDGGNPPGCGHSWRNQGIGQGGNRHDRR
jgi:predicted RNase H-related nuclease YkuK (DUF458 family)